MERAFTVDADRDEPAVRLDGFLHRALPGWSRRLVHRLIAEGGVRVNGRRVGKGTRLRRGDHVVVPDVPDAIVPEPGLALRVLHEDAALVAVDKPGGMPSHALDPRQRGTAVAFVLARWPETRHVGHPLAPGLVHRLDTGTSGVLLAARDAAVHAALRAALAAGHVEKRYLAVVAGAAAALDGRRVDVALAHDPRDRRRMIPAQPSLRTWPARTAFRVADVTGSRSLVEATIRTGVTHQVRVHLAHLGHPVLGDALYGGAAVELPHGRHALHAASVALTHPADGRSITVAAELPDDLRALL
jgi:23S rRNA pseudouridine1911/1915/1917 synthase